MSPIAFLLFTSNIIWTVLGWKLEDLDQYNCPTGYVDTETTCWKKRVENVAVFANRGDRRSMEDELFFENDFGGTGVSVYAIFDGHGGGRAARYVTDHLTNTLRRKILAAERRLSEEKYSQIDYKKLLKDVIATTEKKLLQVLSAENNTSGTTVLIVLRNNELLYVANVGDSRAIMSDGNGQAIPLSFDHKPKSPTELERIEKASGTVVQEENKEATVDNFTVSRTLGDWQVKSLNHIIAEPDVFVYDLSRYQTKFLILGSDGLRDSIQNDEAVKQITEYLGVEQNKYYFGTEEIANFAYDNDSYDNITVLVVNMMQ